ncbi:MAG: ribosomal protein methylthiotransferase accessory factor [Candidatus Eremiobacteraeota bacterium]|nr:ribosomal protein methylthiotransferase accessory factor [Candidatus Eremiobacteraeota bacterium]
MSVSVSQIAGTGFLKKYPFMRAVQPFTGIVPDAQLQMPCDRTAEFFIGATTLGDMTHVLPSVREFADDFAKGKLGGSGTSLDEDHASAVAVAEALERYCMVMLAERDVVEASANELGAEATDWRAFPAASENELADPKCPLRRFDPSAKIRWVRGWSLTHGRRTFVPLVMTHLYLTLAQAERFYLPISTGVSAHTDMRRACVSAICEVIERDAIALTWLGRLPLTRLEIEGDGPNEAAPELAAARRRNASYTFFDATTDLGIPTTLCIQSVPGHSRLAQLVSCATHFSPGVALSKAIREAACVSTLFEEPAAVPGDVADFTHLMHGSTYMARPEQRHHFGFLLGAQHAAPLAHQPANLPHEPGAQLDHLRDLFRRKNMDVVLVDLTVDEVRRYGLSVVRAVIPALMPMTFTHRARFLGHPRLYDYARSLGRALEERSVNSAPMPFA